MSRCTWLPPRARGRCSSRDRARSRVRTARPGSWKEVRASWVCVIGVVLDTSQPPGGQRLPRGSAAFIVRPSPAAVNRGPGCPSATVASTARHQEGACRTSSTSRPCRPRAWSRRRSRRRWPGCGPTRRATQEQVRPRLHRAAGRRGARDVEWVTRILKRRARPRRSRPSARGDRVRGRRHPDGLRVLRVRPVDQRDVHASRTPGSERSGSSWPTAWTSPRSWRRTVQVRPAEVEARRHDPRLLLRDQGRVLTFAVTAPAEGGAFRPPGPHRQRCSPGSGPSPGRTAPRRKR